MTVDIRRHGLGGQITLNRPAALNALTHGMVLEVSAALSAWKDDPAVKVVLIDSASEKAFCAGGDVAAIRARIVAGDHAFGRHFWQDEYRMNAQIARYPKPIVSFLNGYVMGGGVGIGCHASHRIVGGSSRVAMPECSIGLIPDVGGSLLLARASGRLGEYLALTASRMTGPDAIHAGFADHFIPEDRWPDLKDALAEGDLAAVEAASVTPPPSPLAEKADEIDRLFASGELAETLQTLTRSDSAFARDALARCSGHAPISMASTLRLLAASRAGGDIEGALAREYRYVFRVGDQGDFVEGIRARLVDKDNAPCWRHSLAQLPSEAEVQAMLAPLGEDELRLTP